MADTGRKKKSPRKRMKGIFDKVIQQMEFYFSDANLSRDRFMKQKIDDTSDGYLELSLFMNFNKLRKISTDMTVIAKALSFSNSLQLNEEKTKVKRKTPYTPPKDTDERTVYVECLPHKTNHEWISTLFSSCGKVTYVSLPKYKSTGDRKGFAFVEFEDVESARKACEELNNPPVEAGNKPGKFPKSNKQLLYYRDRVAGQTQEMEEGENQKNEEKAEEVVESKATEFPGKSKKAKKRRRMTSESSADGGTVGGRKSTTQSVEEKESDSSVNEGTPKKRRKQQGRDSLEGSKEARGDIKSKKQTEASKNEEDTSGKRRMSQSRKSFEEGKNSLKVDKKSDKKEKGTDEDVKHSDLSDSNTQDVTKESKKGKHSDRQSVEGEVPIKQRKQESGKEGDSGKEEKKRKKKDRRKKRKSHKDKTLPELRVLPKKEWLKLREEYLSLQKKSMSELKESLKQIKQNQPVDDGENNAEKVIKPEVAADLVETPDVIIRVQCASDMNRKQIKEDLGTEVNVAYIDVKDEARDGYIRFKDADSAKKISESSIKSYLFTLLKGDDEKAYWQKLKSDREAKHNTKSSRKKIKGTQKLIDRTEKINKENISRTHIKFDDDDE